MNLFPKNALRIPIEGFPKQLEFIQNKEYLSAFIAGLGSGKSHGGALKSLGYVLANLGANGLITAPSYRLLLVTFDKYLEIFPAQFIKRRRRQPPPELELIKPLGSSRLYFWSTDKPETIQAIEVAFAHMDEGGLSPAEAFRNVKQRIRQVKSDGSPYPYQLWVTTTPRQLNWVYKEFVEQNRFFIQASTRDNLYRDAEAYIKRMGLTEKEIEQYVEGKFTILAGDCLFTAETLQRILENDCVEPLEVEQRGLVLIWKKPVFGVHYIAGADCADEGGEGVNDCIITEETGEEVAEIHGDISAEQFASVCYEVCGTYNKTFLAVERNNTVGGTVTTKLSDMGYTDHLYKDSSGKIGWNTSFGNRYDPLLVQYKEAVEKRQTIIRSSDAIGEMSTFVRDKNGKYCHLGDHRDDRVMARAICWQVRKVKPQVAGRCVSFSYRENI